MRGAEIIGRCRLLAGYTEEPGFTTRTFLSPPMHDVYRLVRGWMEDSGMRVHLDAAGNLRGLYGDGPRLMIGSHLDTVPRAGAFDGVLGVMIAIELVARRPACAIEVAAFSDEEGVRFGIPFIGSRAVAGDPVMEPRVLAAMGGFGLDPGALAAAAVDPLVRGYLEFHIEQGPVLESLQLRLGVVDSIAGQSRLDVRFEGRAGHAGIPGAMRRDALAGAAEWIGSVEREMCATPGLVATVGKLEVAPGAENVVPGMVRTSLDVRAAEDDVRAGAVDRMLGAAREIARRRRLEVLWDVRMEQRAVAMAYGVVERGVRAAGFPVHRMASMAGHDAMILARKVPAAMLFLRSPGGVSHHPDESVLAEDVDAALEAGERILQCW